MLNQNENAEISRKAENFNNTLQITDKILDLQYAKHQLLRELGDRLPIILDRNAYDRVMDGMRQEIARLEVEMDQAAKEKDDIRRYEVEQADLRKQVNEREEEVEDLETFKSSLEDELEVERKEVAEAKLIKEQLQQKLSQLYDKIDEQETELLVEEKNLQKVREQNIRLEQGLGEGLWQDWQGIVSQKSRGTQGGQGVQSKEQE